LAGALWELGLLAIALAPQAAYPQVAVIVNRGNPVVNLSSDQLQRLYLGASTTFPNGGAVVLLEYPPARRVFYESLLQMSELAVTRHWIGVLFRGENASALRAIDGAEALRRAVAETPGALAFITVAAVDSTVKVVTVDGRHPRDPGYPLR
jgi:ABC-type phosphate transport system substrate-binding protein